MIKVAHVISSIDKDSGGTSTYMKLMIEALDSYVKQYLVTFNSENNLTINASVKTEFIKKNKFWLFNTNHLSLDNNNSNIDLFHGNGLWQEAVHVMVKNALKRNISYIISPHGMLEPWSLSQGKLKKQVALKLFQYNDIAKAACIHATAPMEVKSIRALGFKNPIAMIPNGIDMNDFPSELPAKEKNPKKILFLSRIHPKKGIENLVEAWKLIDNNIRRTWKIEIVGNGDANYIQSLKEKIVSEQLSEQIEIKNPVFGAEKIKLFRDANLFVLPTFSENFGIVIAEALASYTPVITTKGAPWEDLDTYKCGWWIDIGVAPLKKVLEEAILHSSVELLAMGENGRKLIEEKYSMESVAKQMIQLYEWVLTKEKKPNFIDII